MKVMCDAKTITFSSFHLDVIDKPPTTPPPSYKASSFKLTNGDKFIVWPFLFTPLTDSRSLVFSFNYSQFVVRIVAFDINLDK